LQRRARVITDKLELQAEQTIERYRRIAASSTNVLVNPVTGLPRRLVELPMEVHSAIEAVKLAKDGTIVSVKFWNKLEALKFLTKIQELAGSVEQPVVAGPTTTITQVFMSDCTTDEIKVMERVFARLEARRQQLTTVYSNIGGQLPEDTPTAIDVPPVPTNGNRSNGGGLG
jgi:hypothetical protein